MTTNNTSAITVNSIINAPVSKVWDYWTRPEHITQWGNASDDWHTTHAENDLMIGGKFLSRMEAKDGSFGFDFGGVYDEVDTHKKIAYTMGDGRKVSILFTDNNGQTEVNETFDPESENPAEMQQQGWQAILNNFKKYTEK